MVFRRFLHGQRPLENDIQVWLSYGEIAADPKPLRSDILVLFDDPSINFGTLFRPCWHPLVNERVIFKPDRLNKHKKRRILPLALPALDCCIPRTQTRLPA
jgi:hypothetical protein